MKNRLQKYLDEKNVVSTNQGSGKKGTRTSDHLMVIQFLIDKIVKDKNKIYKRALWMSRKLMILQAENCYFTN